MEISNLSVLLKCLHLINLLYEVPRFKGTLAQSCPKGTKEEDITLPEKSVPVKISIYCYDEEDVTFKVEGITVSEGFEIDDENDCLIATICYSDGTFEYRMEKDYGKSFFDAISSRLNRKGESPEVLHEGRL